MFEADVSDQIVGQFRRLQQAQRGEKSQLAVVISTDLRRRMRNFLAANRIHLPVLAPHEISPDVKSYPVDLVSISGDWDAMEPMENESEDFEDFETEDAA